MRAINEIEDVVDIDENTRPLLVFVVTDENGREVYGPTENRQACENWINEKETTFTR